MTSRTPTSMMGLASFFTGLDALLMSFGALVIIGVPVLVIGFVSAWGYTPSSASLAGI
jgi:hypothetical protein